MANINLSSFMNGNVFETGDYKTVGDILSEQRVDFSNTVIDVTDVQGNVKEGSPSTVLTNGDTVQIMRKSNKSG